MPNHDEPREGDNIFRVSPYRDRNDPSVHTFGEATGGLGSYTTGGRGQYSGVGPRNYRRPDESIREELCERLTAHGQVDATELDVQVSGGDVTLAGSIDNRHSRRVAEDLAWDVPGVRDVHNRIRVEPHGEGGPTLTTEEPGMNLSGSTL